MADQQSQPENDRKQQIIIAAVAGGVVFVVLTGVMMGVMAVFGSKDEPAVAKAPQTTKATNRAKSPAATPATSTQKSPAASSKSPAGTPLAHSRPRRPTERPVPIPGLPPTEHSATPAGEIPSTEEEAIPESSLISGKIVEFDESILNVTEEDIRRQKAMQLESSLDSYQERLAGLESQITKHQTAGDREEVAELEAKAAETRAAVAELQSQLAALGPISDSPFPMPGTRPAEPSHQEHSAVPSRPSRPSRPPRKRAPLPSSEQREAAIKQVEEIFEMSNAKTDEQELKVAGELFDLSRKPDAVPAERFAMLRKAAEMASAGGDAALMVKAVDTMAYHFEMDALTAKGTMLTAFAKKANNPKKVASLMKAAPGYAKEAVAAGKLDFARTVANATYTACQGPQGKNFRKEALDFRRNVQKLCENQEKFDVANRAIEANPDDADAHLALGQLYCFGRGEWSRGLPHLAKGSDADLAAAAKRELSGPSGDEQVEVGDLWWELAMARTGDEKKNLMVHAARWYKRAQPGLTGITKAKVNKRIGEVEKLVTPKSTSGSKKKPIRRPTRLGTVKHPADSVQFGGHWYKAFHHQEMNWAQAQQACQQNGGYLACAETEPEMDFIKELAGRKGDLWIGALSNAQGQWFWVTRAPVDGRRFDANFRPQEAARAVVGRRGCNDRGQADMNGFICEWDR